MTRSCPAFCRQFSRVLIVTALLIFVSCTFEYDQMLLSDEEKALIPDVRLENLAERVYQDGDRVLELRSAELSTYESRQLQELIDLEFSQYDAEGLLRVSGKAAFASRNLGNDDILLQDVVEIFLAEDSSTIRGEEFLFSPSQDLIWSPDGYEVELVREDGSVIRGRGFVVDLVVQEIRFDRGASGRLKESADE